MRKIVPMLCWVAWSAYLLTWPLDTVLANFENNYFDPQEGPVQKLLFDYLGAYNYLLLAAIALSSACLLQRCISRSLARPAQSGGRLRSQEPTSDALGNELDPDSRLSGRKIILASIAILVVAYAISWWFRPFLNAPTILAAFWIGTLAFALCRRSRERRTEGVSRIRKN